MGVDGPSLASPQATGAEDDEIVRGGKLEEGSLTPWCPAWCQLWAPPAVAPLTMITGEAPPRHSARQPGRTCTTSAGYHLGAWGLGAEASGASTAPPHQ